MAADVCDDVIKQDDVLLVQEDTAVQFDGECDGVRRFLKGG